MVIFRIFFNLFHMAVRLLFLPLHLLMHNFMLLVIIIGALLIYRAFEHNHGPTMVQPGPSAQEANPAGAPGKIDAVRRHEDGDSAFATDLYASMTELERNYYSSMFYSVMDHVPDETAYPWTSGNTNGSITPVHTFINNDGITCRNFKETLKVHSIEQTLSGTACPQGDGGWCKLKPNATPSCGLGNNGGGSIFNSLKSLF